MTISTRGRCSGSGPRPARRFSERALRSTGSAFSCSASLEAIASSEIFQGQVELVGIELFRAPAELHPLQLADQVSQPVVLAGELIALFDQPCLFGPLGVALGPRRQHQARSAAMPSGRASWVVTAAIIARRRRRGSLQP
jgi:hypothetical protein